MPSSFSNAFIKTIVNSPLHRMLGPNFAVLTVTGRKSGKDISFPVNAFRQGDFFTVITLRERNWWRNLQSEPRARLRIDGKKYEVAGEVVETQDEIIKCLRQYFCENPEVAKYFNVRLSPEGQAKPEDLEKAAAGRLVVRLKPTQE
jgi:deazaflavin-dependent oxidoreductase (nitroreductase family)